LPVVNAHSGLGIGCQDPRWCACFKNYITEAYAQDMMSQMDEPSAKRLKELALNFLLFWLDVSGKAHNMIRLSMTTEIADSRMWGHCRVCSAGGFDLP
jgi:hypothetical protein